MPDQDTPRRRSVRHPARPGSHRGRAAGILVLTLAALISAAPPAAADTSVAEVNAAGDALNAKVTQYLKIGSAGAQTGNINWQRFFAKGESRMQDIESSFARWSRLLDKAIADGHRPPGYQRLTRYRDALDAWIRDQREQLGLSRNCFDTSGGFRDQAAAASCYERMLDDNAARWQANANRLTGLFPR